MTSGIDCHITPLADDEKLKFNKVEVLIWLVVIMIVNKERGYAGSDLERLRSEVSDKEPRKILYE